MLNIVRKLPFCFALHYKSTIFALVFRVKQRIKTDTNGRLCDRKRRIYISHCKYTTFVAHFQIIQEVIKQVE